VTPFEQNQSLRVKIAESAGAFAEFAKHWHNLLGKLAKRGEVTAEILRLAATQASDLLPHERCAT